MHGRAELLCITMMLKSQSVRSCVAFTTRGGGTPELNAWALVEFEALAVNLRRLRGILSKFV